MPYALRTFTCPDCGQDHQRRRPEGSAQRCLTCRIAWSAEQQRQLHEHSGPHYERWAWANAAAARRVTQQAPAAAGRRVA